MIESPASNLLFRVDQQITLSASATDPDDGSLDEGSFQWKVLQHHTAPNPHDHPYFSGTGNNLTIDAPAREDLQSTGDGNYLEIRLTVTDSDGLSRTISRSIQPNRVMTSFETQPHSNLDLLIEGASVSAPQSLTTWEGQVLNVEAPAQQILGGKSYEFASWSDGGARSHNVVVGASPATYTANYTITSTACTITGTPGGDMLLGTEGDDVICGGGGSDTLNGDKGKDTMEGQGNNDTLKGEGGDDDLSGGGDDDTLNSKDRVSGNDTLDGGTHINGDTAITDATEKSIIGVP